MGRAILAVDFKVLEDMLHLPEGYSILAAQPNVIFNSVNLLLESPALPEVQEGQEYPYATALVTVEYDREQPGGRKYTTEIKVRE